MKTSYACSLHAVACKLSNTSILRSPDLSLYSEQLEMYAHNGTLAKICLGNTVHS